MNGNGANSGWWICVVATSLGFVTTTCRPLPRVLHSPIPEKVKTDETADAPRSKNRNNFQNQTEFLRLAEVTEQKNSALRDGHKRETSSGNQARERTASPGNPSFGTLRVGTASHVAVEFKVQNLSGIVLLNHSQKRDCGR